MGKSTARVEPRRGRPPEFNPTFHERQRVKRLAEAGASIAEIARSLRGGVSRYTVRRYFPVELGIYTFENQIAVVPGENDREMVKRLAGLGIAVSHIAAVTCGGITVQSLYTHFRQELLEGQVEANERVANSLFHKAVNGDTQACIWWTKSRMGWSEKRSVELSGPDGGPIQVAKVERVIVDGGNAVEAEYEEIPDDG